VENQHRHIKGYRDLTPVEVAAINEVKELGDKLELLCARVGALKDVDRRWHSIGVTDLQKGLMALTRSIAKPTTF
jgi:hypothetical protein